MESDQTLHTKKSEEKRVCPTSGQAQAPWPRPHHGLLVRLLDDVAADVTVAIVLGWFPFQGNVKAPHLQDFHSLRGAG